MYKLINYHEHYIKVVKLFEMCESIKKIINNGDILLPTRLKRGLQKLLQIDRIVPHAVL